MAFQVVLTPDIFQKNKTPDIIGEAKITGEDGWTGRIIEAISPAINTTLPDDSTITEEMSKVQ